MHINIILFQLILFVIGLRSCSNNPSETKRESKTLESKESIRVGAEDMASYMVLLQGKRVGCVVNQTSNVGQKHLVDTLIDSGIDIVRIFAPEHGFRGIADAGASITDGVDISTGLPIVSLYGKNKKPRGIHLSDLDVVVFDIQDVGARFYTYLSTLHYVMEACAENNIVLIVLDRPNPNGHIIDGPVLKEAYQSFVGMHPIPILHGMTLGELANMINEEGWLSNDSKSDLTVIPCRNYRHDSEYILPVPPSPNLPNYRSILLYPHLCLFEGTEVSVGRGTKSQFQVLGHPDLPDNYEFTFTPVKSYGAQYPKFENKACKGVAFTEVSTDSIKSWRGLNISYLLDLYNDLNKETFFLENLFFDKLAGTDMLRKQIINGVSEKAIKESWQKDLDVFKQKRMKYLLYTDK